MAVLLEDVVKAVEAWLKILKKPEPYIDPNLDPVLIVPGIAGSILHALNGETGKEERVWVRIWEADHEFRAKLWCQFDSATGKTMSLDPNTSIVVPEDRDGLYAIDCLDPDMVRFLMLILESASLCIHYILVFVEFDTLLHPLHTPFLSIVGRDSVCYFHDMINEMTSWGYQEGKTLFGFGYDFRQSNRLKETMDRLAAKLDAIYTASGGKKINVITHSMGGLLLKCFMSLHSDVKSMLLSLLLIFEKYVKNWIAIAAPFQGAPGYVTSTLLNGMSFVEGWEAYFFVSKWSMHQLLIECPSIYELMACLDYEWEHDPMLQIWKEIQDGEGNSAAMLETFTPVEAVSIFTQALSNNELSYDGVDIPLPFNKAILHWANKTREILSSAKLPPKVKFYNVYGTGQDTPQTVSYGSVDSPVSDLCELPFLDATYVNVDGDGTVPVESAKMPFYLNGDKILQKARVGIPGDHRGILKDKHLFRIVKHWLKADHDPFYNPVNDYVILPTLFELKKHHEKGVEVTSLKEEWEFVSKDQDENNHQPVVGSISASRVADDRSSSEEARATFIVHPQSNGKQHVELNAMSVTAGGA
ncbi:Lecithin:cholesterol/phospholipid:diacylglycerol acyltransferase [Cynara cardunculus var. scolymus]|uniref:Lecithin:cholesterol/phospholipid:diacylglycerol acyltransferase n=1 Tax=Cynara cardunculus var. scolymus TaxID=59895 RepID=A0A124SBX7_CYNCS|nr:Lecithin:cholesterol/phospholipid:diacylglycerol acyltransferase [Cynara cardunculus var. scolymus]